MSSDDQIEAGAARARLAVQFGFKGEVSDADLLNASADAIDRARCRSTATGMFLDYCHVLSRAIELALGALGAPPAPSTTR